MCGEEGMEGGGGVWGRGGKSAYNHTLPVVSQVTKVSMVLFANKINHPNTFLKYNKPKKVNQLEGAQIYSPY